MDTAEDSSTPSTPPQELEDISSQRWAVTYGSQENLDLSQYHLRLGGSSLCLTWMLAALYLRILIGVFFFYISSLSFGMCSGLFYPTVLDARMYLFSSLLCSAEYGRRTIAEWAYVLSSNIEIMGVS